MNFHIASWQLYSSYGNNVMMGTENCQFLKLIQTQLECYCQVLIEKVIFNVLIAIFFLDCLIATYLVGCPLKTFIFVAL